MWIYVAKDKNDVHFETDSSYVSVYGNSVEQYYFGDKFDYEKEYGKLGSYYFHDTKELQNILEEDGFLTEMWNKIGALFDWYECDYFDVEKTQKFKEWIVERLSREVPKVIKPVYEKMLLFAEIGISCNTGMAFNF